MTALTNSSGVISKTYEYDAFGNEVNPSSNDFNPFRYCGEYYDNETESIYLRARYYNPSIGRFTTEDPIKDGLNWYAYCGGNPVMFWDPSGLKMKFDNNSRTSTGNVSLGEVTAVKDAMNTLLNGDAEVYINGDGEIQLINEKEGANSPGYQLMKMLETAKDDNGNDIVYNIAIINEKTTGIYGHNIEDSSKYIIEHKRIELNFDVQPNSKLITENAKQGPKTKNDVINERNAVTVGHEMIHAARDFYGDYIDPGIESSYIDNGVTSAPVSVEEFYTVGLNEFYDINSSLGKNPYMKITENDIRRSLSMPLRGEYR